MSNRIGCFFCKGMYGQGGSDMALASFTASLDLPQGHFDVSGDPTSCKSRWSIRVIERCTQPTYIEPKNKEKQKKFKALSYFTRTPSASSLFSWFQIQQLFTGFLLLMFPLLNNLKEALQLSCFFTHPELVIDKIWAIVSRIYYLLDYLSWRFCSVGQNFFFFKDRRRRYQKVILANGFFISLKNEYDWIHQRFRYFLTYFS